MNRIIINEADTTTDYGVVSSTDIVYIPGFSDNTSLEAFSPVLCTSVAEFESKVGSAAPYFSSDQSYVTATTTVKGFPTVAIPDSGTSESAVMFAAMTVDPSYVIAKELVLAGIPVLYEKVNGGVKTEAAGETEATYYGKTIEDMYHALENKIFTTSADASGIYKSAILNYDYSVKYITSGGYPTFEYGILITGSSSGESLASAMASIAQLRGDAIALIDHTDNAGRALIGTGSVFNNINSSVYSLPSSNNMDTFAAMYTPYASYSLAGSYKNSTALSELKVNSILPGSFAYLMSLAKSLKTNPNWLVISGVSRGLVPSLISLHTSKKLTNAIADAYQPEVGGTNTTCLNAITNINGYGYCIWGNRTLQKQAIGRVGFATKFVNLRNILSDIKKQSRSAALSLMFEQNNDVLWANFKSKLTPLLDSMVSGAGLSAYKIIKSTTDSKTKLACTIKVFPIYSVESFEINIAMTDEEIDVE